MDRLRPLPALAAVLLLLLLLLLVLPDAALAKLSKSYYNESCPRLEEIIQQTVVNKQIISPTTAAGALRLFFHDCFVNGCDGSILITSNPFNKAERDADINLSLPGDAFDVVVRAKSALEVACPGVVSCADILALATRDLLTMLGGPFLDVKLGRKDSLVSRAEEAEEELPTATTPMTEMITRFEKRGFTVQEMVALTGAHTVGFSHCKEFAHRLYGNGSKTAGVDPTLHPRFAHGLKKACENYKKRPAVAAFNDIITPNKFDNMYYQNLPRGLGLLASDVALLTDERTRPYVQRYAANQTAFFDDFVRAMEKLSIHGIKSGEEGEVRRRCDGFNSLST